MSTTESCGRYVDAPVVVSNSTSTALPCSKQSIISYDLYRAIEELRSVPILRWPDERTFDDIASDVGGPAAGCNAATRNASTSDTVVESASISRATTTAADAKTVSTVSSEWSYVVQRDGGHHGGGHALTGVDGNLTSTSSSVFVVGRQPEGAVSKHVLCKLDIVEQQQRSASDAGNERLSDDVFVDVVTPIDADLLIDDVYERQMDRLDQLDGEVIGVDDLRDLPLPESSTTDRRIPCVSDSSDVQSNGLSTECFTEEPLVQEGRCAAKGSDLAVEVRSRNVSITFPSAVCRVDTSAEELFEEIVESMTDTISEDDVELDTATGTEDQLRVNDADPKTSGRGELETTVDHQNFAAEKFVDDTVASPAQRPTWPSIFHSETNDTYTDAVEEKRQKDLTVSLASTLDECLNALSRMDAGVRRQRKYDATNSDRTQHSSSSKRNSSRRYVTSSSSGFQSDIMDVDIDEEFDANAAFDVTAADSDLGALGSTSKSTSLDSLLDDDEEAYSQNTIIRRPGSSTSRSTDNHSTFNGITEKSATPPRTGTSVTAVDRTERTRTKRHEGDDVDRNNESVVQHDEKLPKLEVLAEELITQEIVLNIILPRRSKNKKRAEADGCTGRLSSDSSGAIERRKSSKTPFRDIHIHRVVSSSDAASHRDNRPTISERAESTTQSDVAESEAVENGDAVNGDDERLDLSAAVESSGSLASRYVGGPLSVVLERDAESATTERLDDDTCLHLTRRQRVKVLQAPDGSGTALFNAPVTGVRDVIDELGRTLVSTDELRRRPPLSAGVRVTCDAVERKSTTSLPDDDVVFVRRTIVDDSDRHTSTSRTNVDRE